MIPAFYVPLLLGALGGILVVVVFYGILSLKLYRLQFTLATVQQHLLSLQSRTKADTRWSKDKALEQELLKLEPHKNVHSERFANDPMSFG